jgi:hypothetical protein
MFVNNGSSKLREKSAVIYFNALSLSLQVPLTHHIHEVKFELEACGMRMIANNRLHSGVHELHRKYAKEPYHLNMHKFTRV